MTKKVLFVLTIVLLFSILPIFAEPNVFGPSAILIDANTGRVLYEKNSTKKMYPASTTKIVTGLLGIEKGNLSDIVTVGINPSTKIERGSSQIYLIPNEQMSLENLLYALMLESANDAAIAVAEHISGSIEDFSKLMNQKAKELGAENTNFVNPNGLHADDHYTTAKDLSLIAFNAMKNETFRKIVSTYKYSIPETNKQEAREYIRNSNKLIWDYNKNRHYYEHAIGIKTGYTQKAKHCLVGGAQKDGMELIAVVLGTDKNNLYRDITSMLEFGFENFNYKDIIQENEVIATVNVSGTNELLSLASEEGFCLTLTDNEYDSFKSITDISEEIHPPVQKGDVLGSISYAVNNDIVKTINLVSSRDIESPSPTLPDTPKKSWYMWLLYFILIFLLYRGFITFVKLKRKKRSRTIIVRR